MLSRLCFEIEDTVCSNCSNCHFFLPWELERIRIRNGMIHVQLKQLCKSYFVTWRFFYLRKRYWLFSSRLLLTIKQQINKSGMAPVVRSWAISPALVRRPVQWTVRPSGFPSAARSPAPRNSPIWRSPSSSPRTRRWEISSRILSRAGWTEPGYFGGARAVCCPAPAATSTLL